MYRGSRKHILDWVEAPEFPTEMLELIGIQGVALPRNPIWTPRSYRLPDEARLEGWGPRGFGPHPAWEVLAGWWLVHRKGANTPNWDLVMPIHIGGAPGLLLCEAKANVAELGEGEKTAPSSSTASHENHQRIGLAIAEARDGLAADCPGIRIDRDRHYQLSNRLAFMWKLASLGIPVVLMYLGFLDDDGLNGLDHFQGPSGWDGALNRYVGGVSASDLLERRLSITGTPAYFISRSRRVLEASPHSSLAPYGLPLRAT